jgi:hypothetical protein
MLERFRDERAETLFRAYRETVSSTSSWLILYTANNLNSSIASIRRQSTWNRPSIGTGSPLPLPCLAVCGLSVGVRGKRWSSRDGGAVVWEAWAGALQYSAWWLVCCV